VDVYRDLIVHYLPYILQGVTVTLRLTVFSLLLSVVLGLLGAMARTSRSRLLRAVATTYVEVIRGTPALLQLFIIYFGLANYQVRLSGTTAAIIALGVLGGAYLTETFRAGIEAVDRGQVEAAKSLGMRGPVIMRRIVLPQAILIILPPFGNFVIGLIKDTSLALTISVPELMYRSYDVSSQTFRSMEVFMMAGVIYLAICYPLGRGVKYLERFRPPQ
jgi:polar amino acid transport system permease protein